MHGRTLRFAIGLDGIRCGGLRRWMVWAVLLATVALGDRSAWSQGPGKGPGQGPAPVRVAKVERRTQNATVNLVGDVVPIRRSVVASSEAEVVLEYPIREGQFVEQGQLLAKLDASVLELELASAEGTLAALEAELLEYKNGSRPETIEASLAGKRAAEAMHAMNRASFDRAQRLFDAKQLPREDYDRLMASLQSSEQQMLEASARYREIEQGPRVEQIAQAEARVRAQLAIVEKLSTAIKRHQVVAPFSGFITAEHTQVGEWILKGGPVAELVDLEEVDIRVLVPSRFAGQVALGAEARVEVDASAPSLLTGHVHSIVPEVDLKSRLFPVLVRLPNLRIGSRPLLAAGMLAHVDLPIGEPTEGLYVPKDALVLGTTPSVYVTKPGSKEAPLSAWPVPVSLGGTASGWVEVRGGLGEGDQVVTQGNERLKPGAPIEVIP